MVLRFEQLSDKIARLTLNRPERSNAFSLELLLKFRNALGEVENLADCRVLLLRSEGVNFCGGLDLREASLSDAASENTARQMPSLVVEILARLRRLPQIVVTAAHGAARAGGGALIAASDLVVASKNFSIAFPEVRRGLVPVLLFPLLRRKLSVSALNELLLTGESVDADRARQLGLVHRVVEEGREEGVALEWIQKILEADPESVRTAKEMIYVHETMTAGCSLEDEFARSLENHVRSWFSASGQEGVVAFLEKREPRWGGIDN